MAPSAAAQAPPRGTGPAARRLLAALVLAFLAVGAAQRPPEADALLTQAREAAAEARDLYADYANVTYDQALWRRAIDLGGDALAAAPGDPEILRFLARSYGTVDWHVRAWSFWRRFLDAGGSLDDAAYPALAADETASSALFAEAGTELGFARYLAGDPEAALPYYAAVAERLPDDVEALTWLGRIHFEAGRSEEALPYWERVVELAPDDAGASYYLARTRERLSVGPEASDAFQRGIAAYDDGDLETALAAFEAALGANDAYVEAAVWAGRTSLDLGRPASATRYWNRVLELDPDDARASYFLEVAEAQARWGVEAATAFYDGQVAYGADDLEAAAERFVRAVEANGDYVDAWVWAGRALQELGRPEASIFYWQGALERDPDDARARYFLRLAEQQLAYGVDAGAAFVSAVESYQRVDYGEAEAQLRRAVELNPDFAAAWGWLGRLYFEQARYDEAAEGYRRAARLEPDNDDYAFFAREAERLAGD